MNQSASGICAAYLWTPIEIEPMYPAPLFFSARMLRLPPLTKIESFALRTWRVPRAAYGDAW